MDIVIRNVDWLSVRINGSIWQKNDSNDSVITQTTIKLIFVETSDKVKRSDCDDLADKTRFAE